MRLGLILFRHNSMPNGHIFRGKYRLVRRVTHEDKYRFKENLEREISNMNYLRFPYLSEAESNGYMKDYKKENGIQENKLAKIIIHQKSKSLKPDVTFLERLMHLRCSEKWD